MFCSRNLGRAPRAAVRTARPSGYDFQFAFASACRSTLIKSTRTETRYADARSGIFRTFVPAQPLGMPCVFYYSQSVRANAANVAAISRLVGARARDANRTSIPFVRVCKRTHAHTYTMMFMVPLTSDAHARASLSALRNHEKRIHWRRRTRMRMGENNGPGPANADLTLNNGKTNFNLSANFAHMPSHGNWM